MTDKLQRLNLFVLFVVVIYTIIIQKVFLSKPVFGPILDSLVTLLTSVGFYRVLILGFHYIINNNELVLKIYWGKTFLDGFWSYTYTIEGDEESIKYFGVWEFKQDLYGTEMIGFGLDENFNIRSNVSSVTNLIENRGRYDIVNIRTDSVDPHRDYYSQTSMIFDLRMRRGLMNYPIKIRAKTTIYGGQLTGKIHNDIFIRHEDASSSQEVIDYLKKNRTEKG